MTINQLMNIFPSTINGNINISTDILAPLINKIEMESGVCENGIDYYFRINLSDIIKQQIPDETIYEMTKSGWILSKNKKYVELIY